MSVKDTKNYKLGETTFCCYCNKQIESQEYFDSTEQMNKLYYKCNCKKATLEDRMNNEIEKIRKEIGILKPV